VRWLGAIFLLALIAIAFAIYSDITMTRCAKGSFFAVLGWCSTYRTLVTGPVAAQGNQPIWSIRYCPRPPVAVGWLPVGDPIMVEKRRTGGPQKRTTSFEEWRRQTSAPNSLRQN
jgi:hypothetical protein